MRPITGDRRHAMIRHLRQYRLLRLLGRGGMGRVYKARARHGDPSVALKLLAPVDGLRLVLPDTDLRRRFLDEANILKRLRHPNIVDVLDTGITDGGAPFYTMAYYGHHLAEIIGESDYPDLPSRTLPIASVLGYMRQLVQGLACLHEAGIVHRDIKPANLLITADDILKICDFGLAKTSARDPLTPRGLKIGSPWYAAPEQEASPDRVDRRADVYSAGVVCYRLAYGYLPGLGPGDRRADLDPIYRFCQAALTPDPADRYADMKAMSQALQVAVREIRTAHRNICEAGELADAERIDAGASPTRIRFQCRRIDRDRAQTEFGTDLLWRPKTTASPQSFAAGGNLVCDRHTGLCWQRSGSAQPMSWAQARAYVRGLNRKRFGGRERWRIPTAAELLSLVTRPMDGRPTCTAPVFDPRQKWLWSCDRQSYRSAWYVSVELGYVADVDMDSANYIRAVTDDG